MREGKREIILLTKQKNGGVEEEEEGLLIFFFFFFFFTFSGKRERGISCFRSRLSMAFFDLLFKCECKNGKRER